MGTTVEALALVAVVLVVMWLAAGIVLRVLGIGIAAIGLLLALFGHPIGLLIAALGALLWAAGHWHYALGHHTYKSPLARRLFIDLLPSWADPTRGWADGRDILVKVDPGCCNDIFPAQQSKSVRVGR
jgi:CDP-diglyceride synthetase